MGRTVADPAAQKIGMQRRESSCRPSGRTRVRGMDREAEARGQFLRVLAKRHGDLKRASEADRPRLGTPAAWTIAFSALAAINAGFITLLPTTQTGRALHHLYDAGHLLFVGASLALCAQGMRLIPARRRWLASRATAVIGAAIVAVLFVRTDVIGFILSKISPDFAEVGAMSVALVLAFAPAIAFGVASWLARPWLRWLPVAAGLGLHAVQNMVLTADYRGIHTFTTLIAGAVIAGALASLPKHRALDSTRLRFAPALALALASPSVLVQPSNVVRQELGRVEGTVLVLPLGRYGWGTTSSKARVPAEQAQWFEPRDHAAPILPSKPSIAPDDMIMIVIGVDSMRADIFDKKENRKRLPNIFALADESVWFKLARSPGSRTLTSWSAAFTGKYYSGLRWGGGGNHLNITPDRSIRFPEILGKAGVTTSTFTAYTALNRKGLTRNFTDGEAVPRRDGQTFGLSPECTTQIIERLRKHGDGRLFLFSHWMDPHFPYDSVKTTGPTKERFMAEVEQVDASLGRLREAIVELGIANRTVLVFVADHGEGFGQHGTRYHSVNLYEELIRVPIFINVPGVPPREVFEPVTLVDLGPTILDLFGQPTPGTFLGQSLVPFLRGENPTLTRPIAAEWERGQAMLFGKWKAIIEKDKGRLELYDLESDPRETKNLADEPGEEGENVLALAQLFFEAHTLR